VVAFRHAARLPTVTRDVLAPHAQRNAITCGTIAVTDTMHGPILAALSGRMGASGAPSISELVHTDPPRTWGVRGIDGPIRAAVDVLVEPVTGSRSRLTISVDFTGHGIGKILVPLMVRREARKEMPANMAALKQRMEAGLRRQHPR
jgi:hypothetical protein